MKLNFRQGGRRMEIDKQGTKVKSGSWGRSVDCQHTVCHTTSSTVSQRLIVCSSDLTCLPDKVQHSAGRITPRWDHCQLSGSFVRAGWSWPAGAPGRTAGAGDGRTRREGGREGQEGPHGSVQGRGRSVPLVPTSCSSRGGGGADVCMGDRRGG